MRIITISRQFGSGGRELGKRLSDILGWDYYDKEIIQKLADENGLNADYVRHVLNNHEWNQVPLTYRNSFASASFDSSAKTTLLLKQREIIEGIAAAGHDCIIVGRDADVILRDYSPFRIYVCADMQSRVDRCMRFENKKPEEDRLSERDILRNIRRIDKDRTRIREMLTGKKWGDSSMFDLTLNAARWDIKKLAPAAAEFALKWFEEQ